MHCTLVLKTWEVNFKTAVSIRDVTWNQYTRMVGTLKFREMGMEFSRI